MRKSWRKWTDVEREHYLRSVWVWGLAGSVKKWIVCILFPFIHCALQCVSYLSGERDC